MFERFKIDIMNALDGVYKAYEKEVPALPFHPLPLERQV
jgi:hypothetical protein